ncbi:uncharacterized protein [Globicephala melas]|uniref:uncharacterized protein isoform X7 n=1 Tax=Globicephala melas TaxID=9731 RepID=UPI003873286B
MTHPAGGPGPAAQSARERASRSFLILAPAALVGSGEDLSRTSLLHCFHQSLSSSMASQWTLSGEMTLKVQAILWQGDEAHRPWSQDAWAQISSFLSDIKSRTGPTHAGGGHPTWHSVSQADGDASDRVSSRQEFGPDPTGTQTWKKGKGHSVRTDVRAPSITQAAESPPRSEASNSPDGSHSVSLGPGMRTTQTVPNQLKVTFWSKQERNRLLCQVTERLGLFVIMA